MRQSGKAPVALELLVGLLAATLALVGSASAAPTAPELADELRIGWIESVTLDPAYFTLIYDFTVSKQIYNALVRYKVGTTELEPDLATRWRVSPDGKMWTFFLRRGVKWHRGFGEFTAQDVKYSFERIINPATKSVHASRFADIDRIEVTDDYTVRIYLKRPSAIFLPLVSARNQGFIVNRKAVERYGQEYFRNPIGTGPYVFKEWVKGSHILLERNADYWEGVPRTRLVRFLNIPEPAVRRLALLRGEIDVYWNADLPEIRKTFAKNPNFESHPTDAPHLGSMILNPRIKPLDDVRVRRAIAYAIDYDSIANGVLAGFAKRGMSVIPPGMFGHTTNIPRYDYDPARARRLLAEAGVGGGFRLTAQVLNQTFQPDIWQVIQNNLRDVGITLDIQLVDAAGYVRARFSKDAPIVNFLSLQLEPEDMLINFVSWSCDPGPNTMACYKGIDELFERYTTEFNKRRQAETLAQIQRKVMEDLPHIPIYHVTFADITSKRVKNYKRGKLIVDMDLMNVVVEKVRR